MGGELVRRGRLPSGNHALATVLGLPECEAETAMIRVGRAHIEFFQFSNPAPKPRGSQRAANEHGISHLCFEVEDCSAEYNRLTRAGVAFHAPPMTMPTGASFTYGRDPDGNIFELIEVPKDAGFPSNYGAQG